MFIICLSIKSNSFIRIKIVANIPYGFGKIVQTNVVSQLIMRQGIEALMIRSIKKTD